MFLGCKRVHIESIRGCCWGYIWSEWKTMNPRWITVCGAAAAWSVGEHHLFFFNGRACGSWHTWAFPSPASSAVGTHGGLEQAGGWRISGDTSEGGNSPWPNIFFMQRITDPFQWVHCSILNFEAEPALSGSGGSSMCCRETQASLGNQASMLGLRDFSLVLRHDPRLHLNFEGAVTPLGFPFEGLCSSCWPAT